MSVNFDEREQLKKAERDRLFQLPDFPQGHPDDDRGVLLSDQIQRYCQQYQLISPFDPELLKPAGYDLRVGRNYSKNGQHFALNDGMELEIEPYQVAIIETYETLNMPEFLIGRWNIRVQLAYEGLLWVGGAQVDPGFRGYLCCPIYNLSTKPVALKFRGKLAMIDFVTTTPFRDGECKSFDWRNRRMLVFPDYPPLRSGIEERVQKFQSSIEAAKKKTDGDLETASLDTRTKLGEIHQRIDTFLALVFTVVAVLFAGLGILATAGPGERSFVNPPAWVAAVALYFALRANRRSGQDAPQDKWHTRRPGALLIAAGAVLLSLAYHYWGGHFSLTDLIAAKPQAPEVMRAITTEKEEREAAIQNLQRQADAKFQSIQEQLGRLESAKSSTK
ncbi:MAG TPA: hypothetical protein VH639_20320 [Bryobacteraceae bacterium]|jgi:deoxycytidine triphosphate deaminase